MSLIDSNSTTKANVSDRYIMTGFSFPRPTTNSPRSLQPDMDETMNDLPPPPNPISPIADPSASPKSRLTALTQHAQLQIACQPIPTQLHLTCQTRELFQHYTAYGTASSLRNAITRYLKRGSNGQCRRGEKPPVLEFAHHLPANYFFSADSKDKYPSRMVDEESKSLVRDMPFRVDRKLHIRPNVVLPDGFLEGIDRVFRIYQMQAEAMLSHCCEKYGDEAIFRVGIRSLILSRSDTLLESVQSHPQHLKPETRLFMLQVYERHPDINETERRILATAVGVGMDTVEKFWSHMTELRAPYLAMRTVIAARELRKHRAYRAALVQQEQQRQQQRAIKQQLWEQRQMEAMMRREEARWRREEESRRKQEEEDEKKKRRRMGIVGLDPAAGSAYGLGGGEGSIS